VPSPYNTHDPTLGRASLVEPVFMNTVATSCAGISVYIDRITARSSTISPSFGKTSLTSMPERPFFENLNGDAYATPSVPGIVFPSYCASDGFGSHVSTCDGAPCAKICTTCFAFTGNCGDFGISVATDSIAFAFVPINSSPSNVARLNAPKPIPAR